MDIKDQRAKYDFKVCGNIPDIHDICGSDLAAVVDRYKVDIE